MLHLCAHDDDVEYPDKSADKMFTRSFLMESFPCPVGHLFKHTYIRLSMFVSLSRTLYLVTKGSFLDITNVNSVHMSLHSVHLITFITFVEILERGEVPYPTQCADLRNRVVQGILSVCRRYEDP